jgi:uncharacterized membrane protein YccC
MGVVRDLIHPVRWLVQRDRGLVALRRAARTAIVMPALFALGDEVIDNVEIATFAAFGSFALLLLADFSGPMRERLEAQLALGLVGAVFVCIGTLASRNAWLAAAAMLVVAFVVLFSGIVSSVLASASTALLLAFILPVSLIGPASAIPDRLIGWGMASLVSLVAIWLLWPSPVRDPLRAPAVAACRAVAARLRADVAFMLGDRSDAALAEHRAASDASNAAVGALRAGFLATPYRPTGLSAPARTLVRLVDDLTWVNVVLRTRPLSPTTPMNRAACNVKEACATVLERGADLLEARESDPAPLREALAALRQALGAMEQAATLDLPVDESASEVIKALDPSFRAQELSFAVSLIGTTIEQTWAAERRSWWERLLGQQPEGVAGLSAAARERAAASLKLDSVWLHNSVRGAVGLALAVLVSNKSGVQHSFWVVLGTLSVLRSNALNTGQFVARGVVGTAIGFVVGAGLIELVGTDTTVLWCLLPIAILLAGIAPAAISFAAGQGAFTLVLLILFNIIQPTGWRVGLVRVEDVALGCGVSLVVGLLFWPRGAAPALGKAFAAAYTSSARYLDEAVRFGMLRCAFDGASAVPPTELATGAAAASRRLDDAFRTYLAERGAKPVSLADMSTLVTGVTALRLAADAVLDLWEREDGSAPGDRAAARAEVQRTSDLIKRWYDDLATGLATEGAVRPALAHDESADRRLVEAVRMHLRDEQGHATPTAVRMLWTGDHLAAARRLQQPLVEPAEAAITAARLPPLAGIRPFTPILRRLDTRAARASHTG